MTREWNGETPYDEEIAQLVWYPGTPRSLAGLEAQEDGFTEAMNDPRVTGLYKQLKGHQFSDQDRNSGIHYCRDCRQASYDGHLETCEIGQALAAYEVGLVKEVTP